MAKVLIIEDETAVRAMLSDLAEACGHDVLGADSLDTARQLLNAHAIEAILLDLTIPLRNPGPALRTYGEMCLREIREHSDNGMAGIVVVTSCDDRELAIELMKAGADDYVWKPFDNGKQDLGKSIQEALRKRGQRIEQARFQHALPQSNGLRKFDGATLSFTESRILLEGHILCPGRTSKQAQVLHYLAVHNAERPTAEIIAADLGYNEPNQGGPFSVHKAISEIRKRAVKHFKQTGVALNSSDFIANRRGATGYEFGQMITIVGLEPVISPVSSKGRKAKATKKMLC